MFDLKDAAEFMYKAAIHTYILHTYMKEIE